MKAIVLFFLFASMITLSSCSESEECQCVRDQVEMLKESRESGYEKPPTGASSSDACTAISDQLKGKSKMNQSEEMSSMKDCAAFAELQKETKLFKEHLLKQLEKEIQPAVEVELPE